LQTHFALKTTRKALFLIGFASRTTVCVRLKVVFVGILSAQGFFLCGKVLSPIGSVAHAITGGVSAAANPVSPAISAPDTVKLAPPMAAS
jgi:hypothetical protein